MDISPESLGRLELNRLGSLSLGGETLRFLQGLNATLRVAKGLENHSLSLVSFLGCIFLGKFIVFKYVAAGKTCV